MGVMNRRNAVLGWAVWKVSKVAAKRKAKQSVSTDTGRSKKGLAAGAAAALGGALFFLRRRRAGDEPS
jgi:LPXTG-motif cell wall-anchored protein